MKKTIIECPTRVGARIVFETRLLVSCARMLCFRSLWRERAREGSRVGALRCPMPSWPSVSSSSSPSWWCVVRRLRHGSELDRARGACSSATIWGSPPSRSSSSMYPLDRTTKVDTDSTPEWLLRFAGHIAMRTPRGFMMAAVRRREHTGDVPEEIRAPTSQKHGQHPQALKNNAIDALVYPLSTSSRTRARPGHSFVDLRVCDIECIYRVEHTLRARRRAGIVRAMSTLLRMLSRRISTVQPSPPLLCGAGSGSGEPVILFEKDAVKWDEELVINGKASLETLVRVGMGIGTGRQA
ncbi:hypothetical protein AB1N83_004929 [Pleurotus pulmonarius]